MARISRYIVSLLIVSTMLFGAVSSAHAQPAKAATAQSSEIVMYISPQCGYCERARQYLQAKGVSWREIDIASSAQAKADFDQRGGVGTPLILVGSEQVTGFNAARLDQLLD